MNINNNKNNFKEKPVNNNVDNKFYSLYKIEGFGSKNNFSISVNNINGLIAWICGPHVIFYDILMNSQVLYLKNINNKILSCISFSNNGKYFITGEGDCKNGEICFYEIYKKDQKYNYKLILSYINHIYGIDKLFFFKDDKYILSIGNKEDGLINIMDIENKKIIYTYKFNINILGADVCNNFAVISGNNFIRIYKFNYNELNKNTNKNNILIKHPVDISKFKRKIFIYVSISEKNNKIYFLTEDGYLVEMLSNQLTLNRWVNLKVKLCFNLTIWENYIGIGCHNGIYLIIKIDDLNHVQTLPNIQNDINSDIICNIYNKYYNKLLIIYSNKLFTICDVNNMKKIKIEKKHKFPNSSIKSMDLAVDNKNGIVKMVTSGDDNNIIYWNFEINDFYQGNINIMKDNKYIRHIFTNFSKNENIGITVIKLSIDLKYLFVANSLGNLNIFLLENNFNKILEIPAHNNKINTIDTISINKKIFLASGSSDQYINVYDISNNIKNINTIFQKMSSEVIHIILCPESNNNNKELKLKIMIAEINSTISFFLVENNIFKCLQKYYDENLKIYCIKYIPNINKIISGHNGKIFIWKINNNNIYKNFEVSKGNNILDNIKIAGDNKGIIFATYNDDNNIRLRALYNGKLLCKIHLAEYITNMEFILDDNYLVVTSIEGFIYFYKINQNFIHELKQDNELINSTEEKNMINNKLKFLQQLIENEISTSKNEKMKKIVEKIEKNDNKNLEDINLLDEFVFQSKKRLNIKHEDNTKNIQKKNNNAKKKVSIINERVKILNIETNNKFNKIKTARKAKSPRGIKINNISPKKFNFKDKISQTEIKNNSYNSNKINIKNKLKYNISSYKISKNIRFSILKENKKKNNNNKISRLITNFKIINYHYNKKDKLIKQIKDININNINKKNDLLLLENKIQLLRDKIRSKLNLPNNIKDTQREKILDTFGVLLIDKINNNLQKKYK